MTCECSHARVVHTHYSRSRACALCACRGYVGLIRRALHWFGLGRRQLTDAEQYEAMRRVCGGAMKR